MTITSSTQDWLVKLQSVPALAEASKKSLERLAEASEELSLNQGQTLLRAGTIETHAFLLLDGALRLLAEDPFSKDLFTVGRLEAVELVGVVDLLRQAPCEAAIARRPCKLLSFPLTLMLELFQNDPGLRSGLQQLESPCEGAMILQKILGELNPPPANSQQWILDQLQKRQKDSEQVIELLSSVVAGGETWVGKEIDDIQLKQFEQNSSLPLRFWRWSPTSVKATAKASALTPNVANTTNTKTSAVNTWRPTEELDLTAVGLREATSTTDLQGFKLIRGKGAVAANLACLRMVACAYTTPCPVDVLEKILTGSVERSGSVPIQGMGQLAESMGLQTQMGSVKFEQLHRLELPVVVNRGAHFALITEVSKGHVLLADPERGWQKLEFTEARKELGEEVPLLLLKRLDTTAKRQFGWGWFNPVIKRFRWPLIQVLLASLFIQLFQLANPLLLQQIIDKVINQSNLSALQVLGAALVTAALFQGLLTAVRTWLMIDTTDRMDLLLGSQVIDKLLRLPLRFFEQRPVGELSQRLSELGNLRSFLTGTAITSALDLLFATIYILIMLLYSPLLTAVALGTIPLYILLILFIAPVYRNLIRHQAQYSARTQSHLIETLSGIQTVKAQHFELNSRWRWQERYSGQIAEGFKSVILGSTAGEVGNFLNQLSSLLIIWVGVYQVVNGDLSLGQLIAFRIIAGYVTGPILRLSSLWQGFQQVAISMERLADIVDQVPEAGENDAEQISLPPIIGKVHFESLKFRFGSKGAYQINELDLEIPAGSFIGIVGQSGSGKSTLMKLLPRLYEPEQGRILIDGYDISKVRMSSVRQQIGSVPQDCLLFDGTIRENIAMNHPEADTESIINVARAAAAHEFIMELSDGYATHLGERGAGLSGGQRQRIAIARTLLQNPSLLVLDEATSALDYDTEATVCRNLQNALQGKTVFFITHRLSTVRHADRIVLLHQGKIAEQGTHAQLMEMGGRYAALYAHQGDT
ncbi:ABC transporter transmembrane domain-containing protein [Prochlorococcus sp. MIT 1306]|uniref:ABC transporter transmembrane domain-containing protein n=1 Tax=Prochlorococcus sp. MIT 1306 TaxID=1799667 RepID=UPI0007B34ED4|nr:ABC transporter transmembrane domain-containing protein [Prochlorococcus sp. MIT 1306]KZR61061.1 Alpha-hemolysin translocation ATP-binding protein HlyB [Prochlorococcus sp. MIT 1306]